MGQANPVNPPGQHPHISGYTSLIQPFSGDGIYEVETFLAVINETKVSAGWSDAVAIAVARSKLKGAALAFWQQSAALRQTAECSFKANRRLGKVVRDS